MHKTLVAALVAAFAGAAPAALLSGVALAAETVRVGVAAEPYPPFTSPDAAGNWSGWEIDIMNALCAKAELDCVVTPVAWDGIIAALTSNRIDAIMSSMSITEERMQSIDFSERYYKTPSVIVGLKDEAIEPTADSLAGKTIGVQVSTTHQNYATTHFAGATIREYQTQDEANQDLVAGRIDATQADGLAMEAFLESAEGKACCELKGPVPDDEAILGAGVGVGLRKGDALRERFNAAIEAIRADGTYDEISRRYFTIDIYGD
jgi:polar amino acid transport system substrate-binding protein